MDFRKNITGKITRFSKTELFSAFTMSSLTTGIQMVTGLVIYKVVAVSIGPAGIAFVGQFQNFKTLATNIASASFGQGVTKYVADPAHNSQKVIATSNIFSLYLSVFLGILIVYLSDTLSTILLKDVQYKYAFIIFGSLLPFFSLNTLLISTVNGFRNYRALAYLKITNNVVALILSVSLVLTLNLHGALIAYSLNSSVVFIISLILLYFFFSSSKLISFQGKNFDYALLKKLFTFTLMALTSAQLKPFVQLFIRDYIIQNGSEFDAGLWQAMITLSNHYLSVITTALGVYYLPKLSQLTENKAIRNEIIYGLKTILSIFLIMAFLIYIFREWIIIILYSKEFLGMSSLFFPQLVGDFFKLFSFLIAYLLLAKAMVMLFMISQIFFSATSIFFSISFFNLYGIEGVIWANALNYLLYSVFAVIAFRKIIFINK